MAAVASAQAKELRRRLVTQLAVALAAYSIAFAAFCAIAEEAIVPGIAEKIADATAPWTYLDEDQYLDVQQALVDAGRDPLDAWLASDGTYAVRDLTLYRAISAFKVPAAVAIYLVGCVVIVAVVLDRAFRAFDAIAMAVTRLLADPHRPIDLPDELSIARAELSEVRERSLAEQRAARAAEQRKNELVAYLAHDIKTPLTSVIGYTSLLAESPDLPPETRERYARTAYDKAVRLDGLIDEFFEITRYNLAAIPLERERIDVAMLCRQVADELFPEAEERGIAIDVAADDGMRAFVDPDKMARALSNVARNAVAYADEGSAVTIRATVQPASTQPAPGSRAAGKPAPCEPVAPDQAGFAAHAADGLPFASPGTAASAGSMAPAADGSSPASSGAVSPHALGATLHIAVENCGREISEAHLSSIFEKFFREDGARQTNRGGAGLGLAIAKEIVVAHGGVIDAHSDHGHTVFTIVVPLGL